MYSIIIMLLRVNVLRDLQYNSKFTVQYCNFMKDVSFQEVTVHHLVSNLIITPVAGCLPTIDHRIS